MDIAKLGSYITCATCKNKKFVTYKPDYGYQINFHGRKYFCSYSCMRKFEKKHPRINCILA